MKITEVVALDLLHPSALRPHPCFLIKLGPVQFFAQHVVVVVPDGVQQPYRMAVAARHDAVLLAQIEA